MKRNGWIREFGDTGLVRGWVQEAYTECLNMALRSGGQYGEMYQPLAAWASAYPNEKILELAAGGGGPTRTLLESAETHRQDLPHITLTDLNPTPVLYQDLVDQFGEDRIGYIDKPVSATNVSEGSPALRMICSAFHHFDDNEARLIMENSLGSGRGLFIMEPFKRDLKHFFFVLLSGPFPYMAAPFRAKERVLRKILFCTLLPIIPLMIMVDGCISVLRVRTPEELEALIPDAYRDRAKTKHGEKKYLGRFSSTFFFVSVSPPG